MLLVLMLVLVLVLLLLVLLLLMLTLSLAQWKNPPSAEGGGPIWVDVRLAAKGCSLDLQTQAGSLTPHQCACPPSAHCSCLEERVQLVLLVEAEWSDDRLAGWARGSLPPRLWGPQLKLFPEAAGDEAIASVARNSGRAPRCGCRWRWC